MLIKKATIYVVAFLFSSTFYYFYIMQSPQNVTEILKQTLKNYWGFEGFRDSQQEIINAVISGQDTIALLPTGGGKSLCYQLPALVLEGTCIVVSPLLALMKDQVQYLKAIGVEAELLSSELNEAEEEAVYISCIDGFTKLLYVSPERLQNRKFLEKVEEIKISFIAIDEAHCISEWGQDFRPSYQNIKIFRDLCQNISCLAVTATATPKVLDDIQKKLNLQKPFVFKKSFKRSNIQLFNDEVSDKYQYVLNLLRHNQSSGIIYTRTRKEAELLTDFLWKNKIERVDYFHAGLPVSEKNKRQEKWQKSNHKVLVSTNAFGMGIDKENVRMVIHFSPPFSLENFYQEIGRAGRDGEDSYAFLLWNEQELNHLDDVFKNQIPNKKEFLKIISYLYSTFMIGENELPEQIFEINISKIQDFTKISIAKIKNVLQFLHHQEIVYLNTTKSLSTISLLFNLSDLENLPKKDSYFIELLLRTVDGLSSHKSHFSETVVSKKMGVTPQEFKERIKEIKKKGFVDYLDGSAQSVKFLMQREDRAFSGKWWNLFEHIQKNKLQKWEEMKFYARNKDVCKMKLILMYFGEKEVQNCGNCYVCNGKGNYMPSVSLERQIIDKLKDKAATLDDLCITLHYHEREKVQEALIFLLDLGQIKMQDFRTYTAK